MSGFVPGQRGHLNRRRAGGAGLQEEPVGIDGGRWGWVSSLNSVQQTSFFFFYVAFIHANLLISSRGFFYLNEELRTAFDI